MVRPFQQPAVVRGAEQAVALFEPLFGDCRRETWLVAHLDGQSRLLASFEAGQGGEPEGELPLRAIIADALRLDSAGLILGQCRPGGDPEPSEADRAATTGLALAAARLGIRLHDHLIFAGGEWRSFRAMGLL